MSRHRFALCPTLSQGHVPPTSPRPLVSFALALAPAPGLFRGLREALRLRPSRRRRGQQVAQPVHLLLDVLFNVLGKSRGEIHRRLQRNACTHHSLNELRGDHLTTLRECEN